MEKIFKQYEKDHPEILLTILRSSVVMGPSAKNFITRALFKPFLIGIRGNDPALQFLHEDDLTEILWKFIQISHRGIFNVAAPGTVQWSELARISHRHLTLLPHRIARWMVEISWWLWLQRDSPSVGLDWIQFPWIVDTGKLNHVLNHKFQYTSTQALKSFLSQHNPHANHD